MMPKSPRWMKMLVAAVALVTAGAVGCFDPKVVPGGLRCAAAPSKECPDGFVCIGGLCQSAEAAGTGGRGGAGGGGGKGGAGGTCAMPIASMCVTPAGGAPGCDPVCQNGCGCGMRCNLTATGTVCTPVQGQKKVGDLCSPTADDCSPGLFCYSEACGTNLGRCARFCREHATCGPGGVCGTPSRFPGGALSAQKVCNAGVQANPCDAFAGTGCPDPAFVCYATGQSTKCDCPTGLNRHAGQDCSFPNDCAAGLTCLSLGGLSRCHQLCRTSVDCGGAACTISGSFGFCP